jgi:hypothetical protein
MSESEIEGEGYTVPGDPEETAEAEQQKFEGESATEQRARTRTSESGPNDEPATGTTRF